MYMENTMHEIYIDTKGKAATAWAGLPPWHGLGSQMTGDESLNEWKIKSGMNWKAEERDVYVGQDHMTGLGEVTDYQQIPTHKALVRSDNSKILSIVNRSYKVVQPEDVIEFYRDLTEKHGFKMHTAGVLKEGRQIWALATCPVENMKIAGIDEIRPHLLLSTSFDYSMATIAKFCTERVVCNNTLSIALNERGARTVSINHAQKFDPDKVKIDLEIGDAWDNFQTTAERMADTNITEEQAVGFFLKVYHDVETPQDRRRERVLIGRLASLLREAPGAGLPTAFGTVWGLLNAVTHDVDFSARVKTSDRRFSNALFGPGDRRKQRAFEEAMKLVEVQ